MNMIVIFVSHIHEQRVVPRTSLVASYTNPTLGPKVEPTSTYLSPTPRTNFSQSQVPTPTTIILVITLKNNVCEAQISFMQVVCEVGCCHKRRNILTPCGIKPLHKPSPFLFQATYATLILTLKHACIF